MGDFYSNLVYSNDDTISFPAGIPGFEASKKFVLVSIPEYVPFEWLVSIDGTRLRFAIINPMLFLPSYEPSILKEQLSDLQVEKPEDVLLYAIVTIHENPLESTANLVGPILINKRKRIGKQVIIDDDRYTTQELILRKQ
jgi:flagellar assembly factor FliW